MSTCNLNGGTEFLFYDINKYQNVDGVYYQAWYGSEVLYLYFKIQELKTGIFKTGEDFNSNSNNVHIYFGQSGGISYILENDQNVYVNKLINGKFEITVCDANWNFFGYEKIFSTRLIVE